MARGLSPLQQQILRLAWEHDDTNHGPYRLLFPPDIFVRLYGWPVTHGPTDPHRTSIVRLASWHFQPSVIGERRYHGAMVSVSRALGRLAARGLLERCRWDGGGWYAHGWELTDQGRTTAQRLMVDKGEKEANNVTESQPLTPLNG